GVQLHAGAATALPDRRAARRLVARGAQQRRARLRRQRAGERGRAACGRNSVPRPAVFAEPDAAAAGSGRAAEWGVGLPGRGWSSRPASFRTTETNLSPQPAGSLWVRKDRFRTRWDTPRGFTGTNRRLATTVYQHQEAIGAILAQEPRTLWGC